MVGAVVRTMISSLIVGFVAFGNTLQAAVSGGQEPTRWQIYSAVIGAVVLMLNDVKSRITPATADNVQTK
jgi:ABC-type uncharacterized transport system permease subunit